MKKTKTNKNKAMKMTKEKKSKRHPTNNYIKKFVLHLLYIFFIFAKAY